MRLLMQLIIFYCSLVQLIDIPIIKHHLLRQNNPLRAWSDSQEENTAELLYFLGGLHDFTFLKSTHCWVCKMNEKSVNLQHLYIIQKLLRMWLNRLKHLQHTSSLLRYSAYLYHLCCKSQSHIGQTCDITHRRPRLQSRYITDCSLTAAAEGWDVIQDRCVRARK